MKYHQIFSRMFLIHALTLALGFGLAAGARGLRDQPAAKRLTAKERQEYSRKMRELIAQEEERKTGPITLEGTVTDEEGKPLEGIEVRVQRVVPSSDPWGDPKSEDSSCSIGSSFNLKFDRCLSVHLEFRKKGYYSRKVALIYNLSGTTYSDPFEKVSYEGNTKVYRDANIVFRKKTSASRLERYGMILCLHPNGDRRVFDLTNPYKRGGPEVDHGYGAKFVGSGESVSSGTIYLEVAPSMVRRKPLFRAGHYDWPANQNLLVVLDDGEDGGLIRIEPKKDKRFFDKKPPWFMREAPREGYRKRMRITQGDLIHFRSGEEVYFYCRLKGKYGKGSLRGGYGEQQGFSLFVRIECQPDGSRDVESER